MISKLAFSALMVNLLVSSASGDIRLSSNVAGDALTEEFHSGDIMSIVFYLTGNGDAAVFGGDLIAAVETTDDVVIRSVTFNPAFSAALGDEAAMANSTLKTTRIQPLGAINRSLGTDAAPVHFATVELEALTDRPFESALIVTARGALVGKIPERTVVLGNESGPDGWGVGRIEIVNTTEREQGIPMESGPSAGNGEQASFAEQGSSGE